MHLMDDSLERLLQAEQITIEDALSRAKDSDRFMVPA